LRTMFPNAPSQVAPGFHGPWPSDADIEPCAREDAQAYHRAVSR
jgi:hypothetical protein